MKIYPSDAEYQIVNNTTYRDALGQIYAFTPNAYDHIPDDVFQELDLLSMYTSGLLDKFTTQSYYQVLRRVMIDDISDSQLQRVINR